MERMIQLKFSNKLTNGYFWEGGAIHEADELACQSKIYSVPLFNEASSVAPPLTTLSEEEMLNVHKTTSKTASHINLIDNKA